MSRYSDLYWNTSDGMRLYARDYRPEVASDALPVIAIHGLTRNSADFTNIAQSLQDQGRRIIAVDVRGRGKSGRAADPMTYVPPVYAADIAALLDAQKIERAIFMGTSMGGLITMALTAIRPDAIAASILNDVGPEVATEGLMRIAAYTGQPVIVNNWDDAVAYTKRINAVAFPHYGDADWQTFAKRIFVENANGTPALAYDPDISTPIKAAGAGALVPDLWPLYRTLAQKPTLIVRGETSDLLSPSILERMLAEGDKATAVEVSGIGHAPMLDEPQAMAAITAFLAEQP